MSGYKYDLFISYSRYGSVRKWLQNHFHQKLVECLADQVAPAPRVYVDWTMPSAVDWPSNLQKALHRSKIMIQLLTPPYFESQWCVAEWRSMQEREKMLGLAGSDLTQGLVYPILYSDSENFPMEGRTRSWRDFKKLAQPDLVFQESRKFNRFHREVNELARDLVQLLQQVPEWQPDWPIVEKPDPLLIPPPPLPRFEL
ncbi:toll/interleukin-1 receptor domain-containing protein [Saccharothrix sp. Mg75]|uniref:toll/interleukin-1 receptor domain-containing protein n=1 Tax=Saccharothrix sp. Mg75 TaxID=3445357 RepID=UPI003EEF1D8E